MAREDGEAMRPDRWRDHYGSPVLIGSYAGRPEPEHHEPPQVHVDELGRSRKGESHWPSWRLYEECWRQGFSPWRVHESFGMNIKWERPHQTLRTADRLCRHLNTHMLFVYGIDEFCALGADEEEELDRWLDQERSRQAQQHLFAA